MSKELRQYCTLKGGSGFPEKYQGSHDGEIPFIKVSDMNLLGNERYITSANHYVSVSTAKILNATIFGAGSVVFAKVGAALLLNRRRILLEPTIIDNNMMAAIPSDIDGDFLYQFLCSVDFGVLVQSGALPSVNQSQIGAIPVPDFSKVVQIKIARILQTIDQAIEKTEALIEKYQQIKAGLMHDLFTRGIGADGQLRPPREQAPELYQQTPIGWIPKEWVVQPLRELVSYISYGFTNPMPTTSEGPFMITAANIFNGKVQYESARRTSASAYNKLLTQKSKPQIGDVLLTKDGSLGRVAIVDRKDICINQSVAVMRPNGNCDTLLMQYFLESEKYQKIMLDDAGGSTIKHIYITVVDKMLVGYPDNKDEQHKISNLLSDQNKNIETEKATLSKLQKLKAGLMHDLLTGKVPVNVEQTEAAHV